MNGSRRVVQLKWIDVHVRSGEGAGLILSGSRHGHRGPSRALLLCRTWRGRRAVHLSNTSVEHRHDSGSGSIVVVAFSKHVTAYHPEADILSGRL